MAAISVRYVDMDTHTPHHHDYILQYIQPADKKKTGIKINKIKKAHTHTHTQRTRFPGVCLYVWGREYSVLFSLFSPIFSASVVWRCGESNSVPEPGLQLASRSVADRVSRFSLYSPNHIQDVKGPVEFDFFYHPSRRNSFFFVFTGFQVYFFIVRNCCC